MTPAHQASASVSPSSWRRCTATTLPKRSASGNSLARCAARSTGKPSVAFGLSAIPTPPSINGSSRPQPTSRRVSKGRNPTWQPASGRPSKHCSNSSWPTANGGSTWIDEHGKPLQSRDGSPDRRSILVCLPDYSGRRLATPISSAFDPKRTFEDGDFSNYPSANGIAAELFAREWSLTAYRSVRTSSTRRLSARPWSVELSPFGWVEPKPDVCRRRAAIPRLINASATALARAAESF